jgi:hypothetical protein
VRRRTGLIAAVTFASVLIAAGALAVSVAAGGKLVPTNPDAGLSDQERDARYSQARAEFEKRYEEWKAGLDLATVDLATLPRSELMIQSAAPEPTLSAAVQAADRIIVGSVQSLRATTSAGTLVTLRVEQTLKGSSASTLTIRQGSSIEPGADWNGMMIGDAPGDPLLLPATRVVLFLQDAPDGIPYVQAFSGIYYLEGGRVRALELNPFAPAIEGLPESDFIAQVAS